MWVLLARLLREYRLLCQVRRNWAHDYYILSAGGGGARRHGWRAPRPANASRTIRYGAPVSCRGVLHWLDHPEAEYTGMMLAFDTASEAFRLMPLLPEQLAGNNTARTVVELDGELAMAVMQHGVSAMAVWDLRDYGEVAEVWTLRYRVEVPMSSLHFGDITNIITGASRWFLPVGDGTSILIGQGCYSGNAYGYATRLYDLKEKRMHGKIVLLRPSPRFLVFRESLVPQPQALFQGPCSPGEVSHIKFSD
ncbi:hypothetical protein HU200_020470 [Digitaria exilis]|uniref:F-box associated domain-containing protein n=1 Tax=Digitaria exilis TaxID=1010633 RepID=A0A835KHB2_9POAL|nr:hypothetical protein HU200_020470 [Digitaria exilis]